MPGPGFVPYLIPVLLSLLLFSFCAAGPQRQTSQRSIAAWSYTGDTGPAYWHTLDSAYRIAAEGQAQSPINIDTSFLIVPQSGYLAPAFNYTETDYVLENNGHTIELIPENGNNHINLDGIDYVLQQFHFHSPSEHRIDGKSFDLEVHFVHKDHDGNVTVAGILFNEGAENNILKELFAVLEKKGLAAGARVKPEAPLNPAKLFAIGIDGRAVPLYRYNGSLTTPPCTEGVKWCISSLPQELSKAQLAAFRSLYYGNNRPVQDLHGRLVFMGLPF
ncbi:carbonic anhydrase [Spirochaetia bacterium]|nr:carbonic anhydrase [Spirochaetia bacterium]